ncbi:tRNA 5-carboxymethoxyuridine methyltransferase [Thiomicrorhabdus immobilis]|uniref:tRNA 5-carboxymethoxyuridine methyltransferase n=1 Tax=Thiomicrorhabdus immobilis TaxID=2791037 RepID=A0ABN6CWM7_9GAMM|nr:methyltransferase domain-containing protein [Thiomicrorhabdus immobilis]BCN92297.1 tRNA 5-carboxymethoxyuridine methyltransferase [Thiomicrorhabdus immobilis]
MKKPHPLQDRNFDKLVDKFEAKVYDTFKGEWRLKLLKEDLDSLRNRKQDSDLPSLVSPVDSKGSHLSVWDAGCGFAQISQWFAEAGHELTLCDLSHQMLRRAKQNFADHQLKATFIEGPAQEVAVGLPQFDVVLFHAVLEWLAQPKETLQAVANKVKPGGSLSLLFYNRNSVVIRNTLKGAWRLPGLLTDDYMGKGKKLTPPNPQIPEEVCQWLEDWGFEIEVHTGIRVFHDYMTPEALQQTNLDELMALEYRYCREPTYRNMARYIHILAKKRAL